MPKELNYSNFLRNIGWATSASFANQLTNVLFLLLASRLLEPAEYGLMAMVLIVTGFSEILVNAGFVPALVQKDHPTQNDYSTVFLLTLLTSAALSISTCLLAPFIAQLFDEAKLAALLQYSSLAFLFIPLRIIPLVIFTRKLNYKAISQNAFLSNFLSILFAMALLAADWGIWAMVSKYVFQQVFSSIIFAFRTNWKINIRYDSTSAKNLWKFSSNQTLSDVIGYWSRKIDDILIGNFISSYSLGIYSFAYNFLLLPTTLIKGQVINVVFPTFVKVKDEPEKIKKLYLETSGALALVSFPLIITLISVSNELVLGFLGGKWSQVIPIINFFCVASLFEVFITPGALFLAYGRADLNLKTTLITKSVNVIAILIGLPFGIESISKLLTFSSIINFIIYGVVVKKLVSISIFETIKSATPPFLISALMYIFIFLLNPLLSSFDWGYIIILIIKVVFSFCLYLFGMLIIRPPLFSRFLQKFNQVIAPKINYKP